MANDRHDVEVRRILTIYGNDPAGARPIVDLMERQFTVLTSRTQVLLALCGIVISTTGFSGRLIASTSTLAQVLVIAGVALVLASAVVVCLGVLHLRWLTQHEGELIEPWLRKALAYRDSKTRYYRIALGVLMLGLALYVAAILVMLALPLGAPPMTSVR